MVKVMKENHQEVDVVDMSGVEQEAHAARYEAEREFADEECAEEEGAYRPEARHEEVDEYINRKFIEGATKGIKSKVAAK